MSKRKKTIRRRNATSLSPAQRAAANFEAGKVEAAVAWARNVSTADSADDLWIAGKILAKAAETALAIEKLERLHALNSGDQEVNFALACCYATAGDVPRALALYGTRSHSERSLLSFVGCLHSGGDDQSAIELLRTALDSGPQGDAVSIELAEFMAKRGDLREAKEILARCVERPAVSSRDRARAWFNLGNLLEQLQAEDDAPQAYKNSIAADEDYDKPRINLAVMLIGAHRYEQAIESLKESTARFPDNDRLLYLLAFALRLTDDFERAITILRSIVDRSTDSGAWELLGRLLAESEDVEAAIRHFRRWLSVEPKSPVAAHMLASLAGESIPGRASESYVTETFDAFADTFESALVKLEYQGPAAFTQVLGENLQAIQPNSLRVMDAGCGTGLIGPVLQPYARELIGVDLSSAMLEKAKQKGIYDSLVCEDLVSYLKREIGTYDLIVASDTFNYFGDLSELFDACFAALKRDGWLVFSVEEGPLTEDSFYLQPHGRFVHSPPYIMEQLGERGVGGGSMNRVALRKEAGKEVHALLVAVQKPNGDDEA